MAKPSSRWRDAPADIVVPRILLVFATFALLLIGLLMVYSASFVEAIHEGEAASSYVLKQVIFAGIGVAAVVVIWKFIPPRVWSGGLLDLIWGLAMLLLILTALIGTGDEEWGARRWLYLGPIGLQPSEFAKIAVVLMAANILVRVREGSISIKEIIGRGAICVLLPIGIILVPESDLGTSAICLIGVLAVMWLGETPLRIMIPTVVAIVVLALIFIFGVSYRASRFVYLDPWNDGEGGYGAGYAIIHSFYAFAEGGLFGVGLGNSREKFLYLPEAETDFIFAVIGEELGMVGAIAVVALFLLFLWAGLRIARSAATGLSAMIAGSCTVMLVFQAFLNIGCVIGVFPTTGKPLPFISSGGSSLIATLIMVGLILSVSREASEPSVYDRRREDLRVVHAQSDAPPRDRSQVRRAQVVGGRAYRAQATGSAFAGEASLRQAPMFSVAPGARRERAPMQGRKR